MGLIDTVGCVALFLNNNPALFQKQAVGREVAIHGEYRQAVFPSAFLRCSKQSITHSQSRPRMTDIGIETGRIRSSAGFQNTFTDLNAPAPTGYDSRGGVELRLSKK